MFKITAMEKQFLLNNRIVAAKKREKITLWANKINNFLIHEMIVPENQNVSLENGLEIWDKDKEKVEKVKALLESKFKMKFEMREWKSVGWIITDSSFASRLQ
jgi:hypothetical protein